MLERVNEPRPSRTAAFFDLDKTIIAKSSTLAFSRSFYAGRADQPPGRPAQRLRAVRLPRRRRRPRPDGADARTTCPRWRPAGTSQQVKDIVAETLHDLIDPIIYDEAATLIEEHHLAGRDVVIVSTSGAEVVEPIGEMLGADHVIATRMVVEDGRYTGEIEYYAYGETKAEAIRELAALEGYDLTRCYAYSDSATDLPMLEAVGHPYAVNPDRALRREASCPGLAGAGLQQAGEAARPHRQRARCRPDRPWRPPRWAPARPPRASSGSPRDAVAATRRWWSRLRA